MEKTFGLDLKDRKILSELDLDARKPSSQIAKKVGLSTEVVNYRIKKLEENKIITGYQTIINLSKLGIIQFKILVSFQHMKSNELEEIIKKLKQYPNIKWIVSCNNLWDLIISLETSNLNEIDTLKDEILSLFKGKVDKKALAIGTNATVFSRDYILNNQSSKERLIIDSSSKVKLEKIDLEILKELSINSRAPIIDIASKLKTTARIVNYRIKQMIKSKIIEGFRITINYQELGIKFYKGFVYLDNPKKEQIEKLNNYFKNQKNIIHNVKVIGNWDFEPEFEVSSEQELNNILTTLKDNFSDIIKKIDIITISKEHKFVYF